MKTCAAVASLLAALWCCAGVARARVIAMNPRAFVLSMMENDRRWAEHLNVNVKVDAALLTPAAAAVVRRVRVARDERRPTATTEGGGGKRGRADVTATTTTVNALAAVAEVACGDRHESDAYDFALAVAASAVKCAVLPCLLAQAQAVERTQWFRDAAANFERPRTVWDTLSRYLNKLGRMRESLRAGADMYRLWETVVRQTLPPSPNHAQGALGDVRPFKTLVEDVVRATCVPGTVDRVYERLDVPGRPEDWEGPDVTAVVFDGCQRHVDAVLHDLPVSAMDAATWRVFLDGTKDP